MYSIYCDGVCIHNDAYLGETGETYRVLDPVLKLSDCAAGSLTMKIPPGNIGYNIIHRMSSEISVKRDEELIWCGRVVDEQTDFWNCRELTCEGALGYLNDTIQPPDENTYSNARAFLAFLIANHNEKSERKFGLGAVTVAENEHISSGVNYESTLECINTMLVENYGGHLRINYDISGNDILDSSGNGILDSSGGRIQGSSSLYVLDYLAEYVSTNTQTIRFGVNLLDFTKNWDMTELATVILPRGAKLDESPYTTLDAYTTVADVNNGDIYVKSDNAVAQYGWIAKVVDWEDEDEPAALLAKAQNYLANTQFGDMVLELTAVDLHYLDANTEAIKLLDTVRCISAPHGLDRYFPVTELEIPLNRPEETKYKLGTEVKQTLTSATSKSESALKTQIENIPSKSEILNAAKENAAAIIDTRTNGFITIATDTVGGVHTTDLYISNTPNYRSATKYWRWNMGGLAYFRNAHEVGLALTMDGSIVADRMTTGTLRAIKIEDGTGLNYWDLATGDFQLKADAAYIKDGTDRKTIKTVIDSIVTETDIEYAVSSSNTSRPTTGWSTIPSWESGKYLWSRVKMTLSGESDNIVYSTPKIVVGTTGIGVADVQEQYYLSTSDIMTAGGSWQDTQPPYVPNYIPVTPDRTSWYELSGINYFRTTDTVLVPGKVYYLASGIDTYKKITPVGSAWYELVGGDYVLTADEVIEAKAYSTMHQKYYWTRSKIIYTDGSFVTTPPVLARAYTTTYEAFDKRLTQREVFNRLTDNGTAQGIYMENGDLYINATWLQTGVITSKRPDANHGSYVYWNLEKSTLYVQDTEFFDTYGLALEKGGIDLYYKPIRQIDEDESGDIDLKNIYGSLRAGEMADANSAKGVFLSGNSGTTDVKFVGIGHSLTNDPFIVYPAFFYAIDNLNYNGQQCASDKLHAMATLDMHGNNIANCQTITDLEERIAALERT